VKRCGALEPTVAPLGPRPLIGIDGEATHPSRLAVIERAMMGDLSITEKLREHCQRACGQRLIDEWFLP
jgi:hypothetical protein